MTAETEVLPKESRVIALGGKLNQCVIAALLFGTQACWMFFLAWLFISILEKWLHS